MPRRISLPLSPFQSAQLALQLRSVYSATPLCALSLLLWGRVALWRGIALHVLCYQRSRRRRRRPRGRARPARRRGNGPRHRTWSREGDEKWAQFFFLLPGEFTERGTGNGNAQEIVKHSGNAVLETSTRNLNPAKNEYFVADLDAAFGRLSSAWERWRRW